MSEVPDEQIEGTETPNEDVPTPLQAPTPDEEAEEAEEGEEVEHGDIGEQDAASGPVGAVGERELEKMFKRVDTANATYAKRLREIMGEEADVLVPCPVCAEPFLGLIFPPLMRPIDPAKKPAILALVGEQVAEVSEPDPYSRQCDACKGMGRVLSGSRLNSEKTLVCIPCKGRGWIPVGDERRVPANNVVAPPPSNGAESPVEQPPDVDPWGRAPSDPDYGKLPQYVTHG